MHFPVQVEDFTSLVDDLEVELNATLEALTEATQILELISSKNFNADTEDLRQYRELTETLSLLAMTLWDSAMNISNQVLVNCWRFQELFFYRPSSCPTGKESECNIK